MSSQITLLLGIVLLGCLSRVTGQGEEVLKASQCFKSRGIPKVAFECEPGHMVKILRAFHGISLRDKRLLNLENKCPPSPGHQFSNCTYCEGDCVDDSMNMVYDWSTCMGNRTCMRTVMQSYMPSCPGKDKFSDYLQVEYQCIPRTSVIDICSSTQQWLSEGYLMSPNYPDHYPTSQDCLCTFQTDWNSRVVLSFYDLLLETRNGRCRADWLMLRQKGQKHRHCGAIMTGTKNVTSEANSIILQFHTDENDNRTQNFQYFTRNLKGFWLYFRAEPDSSLQVTCRRLSANDPEVQEIYTDDADFHQAIQKSKEQKEQQEKEQNMVMGEDREDTTSSKPKTRHPPSKDREGGARRSDETGRENEVFKQEGGANSSGGCNFSFLLILSSTLLHLFKQL